MLNNDYMGMVTATLMYAMRERVLMDEPDKLGSPCDKWLDCRLLFISWPSMDFMYHEGLPINNEHDHIIH